MRKTGTYPGQKMGRKIGTAEGSEGDVDWDGPDPETPRDWSGWGKFPGAKYLGIQEEKQEEAEQEAGHSVMQHDMQHPTPQEEPTPQADR